MANEPMAFQLTVAKLRQALRDAPDEAVVGLEVPAPGIGNKEFTLLYNLRVEYAGGLFVRMVPLSTPSPATDQSSARD